MSLWVKRTGQLLLAALFLLACEEEASLLGFRNPTNKFDVRFVELPVESSSYRIDSIRTSMVSGDIPHIQSGEYIDPDFGTIKAIGYTQVRPYTSSKVDPTATVDSVQLRLRFDYYLYGPNGVSEQTFSIHETSEKLKSDSVFYYYSNRVVPYSPTPLGTGVVEVNSGTFNEQYKLSAGERDTLLLTMSLDKNSSFVQSLMDRAKAGDSTYTNFKYFSQYVNGLAVVPSLCDRVVGFDVVNALTPRSLLSGLTLFYHTATDDSLKLDFLFDVGVQYTNVQADRTSSPLSGLTNTYQEDPGLNDSDFRYTQNCTGVVTSLDFSDFIEFSESFPSIVINSAELIGEIESGGAYSPITSFSLHVIKEDNRFRKVQIDQTPIIIDGDTTYSSSVSAEDQAELNKYNGRIANVNGFFTAIGDAGIFSFARKGTSNSFGGSLSLLLQQLYLVNKSYGDPFTRYVLFSTNPPIGSSLHRNKFQKNNFKLRVYYTVPTVTD